MAWIELHQSLPGHRKTMRLRRALKIGQAQAVGHLCMLWLWCLDNCPDGITAGLDDCEIAEAAGYPTKDARVFVDALRESGFIDGDGYIHDWNSYAGKLIEKREQNAQRMRDRRARAEHVQRTCRTRACTDANGENARAQLPYPTVPNPTVPNQEEAAEEDRARDWNPFGETSEAPPVDTIESYLMANLAFMSPGNMQELDTLETDGATPELIRYAVDTACAAGANKWAYVKSILSGWIAAKITTVAAAKAEQERHKAKTVQSVHSRASPRQDNRSARYLELAEEMERNGQG